MKIDLKENGRCFNPACDINLRDMGFIELENDEQITFTTASGKTNDIVKKEWGFYLGNSLNWNLKKQGFKTALVSSSFSGEERIYINLVEIEKVDIFNDYLEKYQARIIQWLDELKD